MNEESTDGRSFSEWLLQPETLVALSAVLLSLCGLFIAVYEAFLVRQSQRASVWPHTEVTGTINARTVTLRVQNTGVGPARIRAAAVTYAGQPVAGWPDMIRSVMGGEREELDELDFTFSLINDRVLPVDAPPEDIFSLTLEHGPDAGNVVRQLGQAILEEGTVDVVVCYCSVYDECWTSHLQDVISRRQADAVPTGSQEVDSCSTVGRSGI